MASAVAVLVLPGAACGIVLGADREAANARRDLVPIDEAADAPNPLQGSGSAGDRASERRQREQQKKAAATSTTTTTMTVPPREWDFVPVAPGLVKEGALDVEAPNSPYREQLPPVLPSGESRAEVDLWPRSFEPRDAPGQVDFSPYCEARLGVMRAGDSLWRRYNVASGPARRLLVTALIESLKQLQAVAPPELAAVVGPAVVLSEAQFGGANAANAENPLLVAGLLTSGSNDSGLQQTLTPTLVDAAKNCLAPNLESQLNFQLPSPDAIDRWTQK